MKTVPYLFFKGECKAAFEFYAQCLRGSIEAMLDHSQHPNPGEVPAEAHGRIMHAHLRLGQWELMGSDSPPHLYERPQGFSVSLHLSDEEEGQRVFNAFAAVGEIRMPFEPTFWAKRFGACVARFGIPWLVNCE